MYQYATATSIRRLSDMALIPIDQLNPDYVEVMAWVAQGNTVAPTPVDPDQARAAAITAVQAHIDAQARAWGYDDIYTAVGYADEPADPQFQAEGQALRRWRSLTWRRCWDVAASVASVEELLALLPAPPARPEAP